MEEDIFTKNLLVTIKSKGYRYAIDHIISVTIINKATVPILSHEHTGNLLEL